MAKVITKGYEHIVSKHLGKQSKIFIDNYSKSMTALKALGLKESSIKNLKKELKIYCLNNHPKDFHKIDEAPLYLIHKDGTIINIGSRVEVVKYKSDGGYIKVELKIGESWKDRNVHVLLAKAFKPNPNNKPLVNHIDGDKTNHKLNNLEWATVKENSTHAIKNGLSTPHGEDNGNSKLTNKQVIEIFKSKEPLQNIADKYGVGLTTVKGIRNGSKHINTLKKEGLI